MKTRRKGKITCYSLYLLYEDNLSTCLFLCEGEIGLDYDMDHKIPDVNTSHHSVVQEEGVEEIHQNYECPECGQNFKTKCDIRIHLGR